MSMGTPLSCCQFPLPPFPPDILRGRIVTLVPFLGRFRELVGCILSFTATFSDSLTSYLSRNDKATRFLDLTATATACSVCTWWAIECLHTQRSSSQKRHLWGRFVRGEYLPPFHAVFRLSVTDAFRSSPLKANLQLKNTLGAFCPFGCTCTHYLCFAGSHTRHTTEAACVALLQGLWSTPRFCIRTNNGVKSNPNTNRGDLSSSEFLRQCDTPHPTNHSAWVCVGAFLYEEGRQGVPCSLGCALQRVAAVLG